MRNLVSGANNRIFHVNGKRSFAIKIRNRLRTHYPNAENPYKNMGNSDHGGDIRLDHLH